MDRARRLKRRMRHTTHVVPETVKPYVEYVWSLESGEECTELGFDSCASGTSGLIIQHHRRRSAFTDATRSLATRFVGVRCRCASSSDLWLNPSIPLSPNRS